LAAVGHPVRGPGEALARRLRALREEHWPGRSLTQTQLAKALSGDRSASSPLISAWENGSKIPPRGRIEAYASFFATPRSLGDGEPRLLPASELTEEERELRQRLLIELNDLRDAAAAGAPVVDPVLLERPVAALRVVRPIVSPTWTFDDKHTVTVVCAPLSEDLQRRMPYTDPQAPDYVELYRFADVDALVELHGHIRAVNPDVQVHFKLATELVQDDYTTHLVVLGGVDWNDLQAEIQEVLDPPVQQRSSVNLEDWDAWFEATVGGERREFRARVEQLHEREVLREDVALFYRAPNPFNAKRTLTICNGIYARGVYAAVRTLTDERFRDRNEEYVASRFGSSPAFGILMRARILQGKVLTPDWNRDFTRLYEWPEDAE
jgi:hypothetical protein